MTQEGMAEVWSHLDRAKLAGLHLMRTGEVVSNSRELNEHFRLSQVDELVARKR